jgi:hypothetical protein
VTEESVSAASPGGFGGSSETAFTQGGDMMMKLIALTMMCDANRSIVMQWPGFITFDWLGHEFDHHGLSHRVGSAAVGGACVSGVIDMLNQIDQWYAGRYTQLVSLIDSIVEGDKTMLDNSAVMWLPELSDGNRHNNDSLPVVIAGSLGGYFKQGQAVKLDTGTTTGGRGGFGSGGVPINKLYVNLLNGLGATDPATAMPFTTFGNTDNNTVGTITNPGEFAELKA